MVRSLAFNREEALDKAMLLFWRRGYVETSVQDLLSEMGINRGSLYSTFGDKKTVFIEALDRYDQLSSDITGALLSDASDLNTDNLSVILRNFFDVIVLNNTKQANLTGCMLSNTIVELSVTEPELCALAAKSMSKVRDRFEKLFVKAKAQNALATDQDPKDLAFFFLNCIHGLRISAKQGVPKERLKSIVDTAIKVIH